MQRLTGARWGTTPCGHRFHAECLQRWLEQDVTCPECRHRYHSQPKFVSTRRMFDEVHEAEPEGSMMR